MNQLIKQSNINELNDNQFKNILTDNEERNNNVKMMTNKFKELFDEKDDLILKSDNSNTITPAQKQKINTLFGDSDEDDAFSQVFK